MKYLNKKISNIAFMGIFINALYQNNELIWDTIRNIFNCFSSGIWMSEKNWTDSDLWKS